MNKSNLNQEIEEFLKIKNELIELIQSESENGSSKDEILDIVFQEYQEKTGSRIKNSILNKLWKDSEVSTRKGGSGYRQRTVELFIESEGEIKQKEWEDVMIDEGLLKSIVNYRQHFATFYHLYHHKMMS